MFDLAVVGGGPAGVAAATAAVAQGLRVCLLDNAHSRAFQVGETLLPSANATLAEQGLHALLETGPHLRSYGTSAVWGGTEIGYRDFIFGVQGLGWHLDRRAFNVQLRDHARACGVCVRKVTVIGATLADGQATLNLAGLRNVSTLVARFVIDASGRHAVVARAAGADACVMHDRLVAVAHRFTGNCTSGGPPLGVRALVEACELGWWYVAPLPGQRVIAALFTDSDLAVAAGAMDRRGWRALLEQSHVSAAILRPLRRLPGKALVRPASTTQRRPMRGAGWLAVGDAAMTFDPLCSQGIAKALRGGQAAALAASAWLGRNDDSWLVACAHESAALFAEFMALRQAYYSQEPRWAQAPFWLRRRRPANAPAPDLPNA